MPLLLEVAPDALDRLQDQRFVVATFAEERHEVLLLELAQRHSLRRELDFRPEPHGEGQIHHVQPGVQAVREPLDDGFAIAARKEPVLEPFEVVGGYLLPVRRFRFRAQGAQQFAVGEDGGGAGESDPAHRGLRARRDPVGHLRAAAVRTASSSRFLRAHRHLESHLGVEEPLRGQAVLQTIDAAQQAILPQRLPRALRQGLEEAGLLDSELAAHVDGQDLHIGPQRDDRHDTGSVPGCGARIDLDLRSEARVAQTPERAAGARFVHRLAHRQRNQQPHFGDIDRGVAAKLECADDRRRFRPRRPFRFAKATHGSDASAHKQNAPHLRFDIRGHQKRRSQRVSMA